MARQVTMEASVVKATDARIEPQMLLRIIDTLEDTVIVDVTLSAADWLRLTSGSVLEREIESEMLTPAEAEMMWRGEA